ncbi:hypothetical protein BDY21DRAFT_341007, partial [Lineolata rhizophorae]
RPSPRRRGKTRLRCAVGGAQPQGQAKLMRQASALASGRRALIRPHSGLGLLAC